MNKSLLLAVLTASCVFLMATAHEITEDEDYGGHSREWSSRCEWPS